MFILLFEVVKICSFSRNETCAVLLILLLIYYQLQKCSPWLLVSGNIRVMWLFTDPRERGRQMGWVVENGGFQCFWSLPMEPLELRPELLTCCFGNDSIPSFMDS